ncbi:MAG: YggT family protein [Gemmatimonadaceae bacterium]
MDQGLRAYATFLQGTKYVVFGLAVVMGVIALVDWLVRTRRLNPFGPIARFCRRFVDPLMAPVERRILRAGGLPSSAPWWTLVAVVVGGLLLIWLMEFLGTFLMSATAAVQSPQGALRFLIALGFSILRIALLVRVVSSWFQMSPYSKWIHWSFALTEWMLRPLRRILPPFGPLDLSPLIAFLLLSVLQGAIVGRV